MKNKNIFPYINSTNRNYVICDKEFKFVATSFRFDDQYQKQIYLSKSEQIIQKSINPQMFRFSLGNTFLKAIQTAAPIDVIISIDKINIVDNEEKAKILASLRLAEHVTETKSTIKMLTEKSLKQSEELENLSNKISLAVNSVHNNAYSLNQAKKIDSFFKDLLK